MIEIMKHIRLKSGDELNKPSSIVMAPTANASYHINGKTIESALGMLPQKRNSFFKWKRDRLSNFTFFYEDLVFAFCDEVSMVGSAKFTKMHFQLQDIMGNNAFMSGLNFIAVGYFQLCLQYLTIMCMKIIISMENQLSPQVTGTKIS